MSGLAYYDGGYVKSIVDDDIQSLTGHIHILQSQLAREIQQRKELEEVVALLMEHLGLDKPTAL